MNKERTDKASHQYKQQQKFRDFGMFGETSGLADVSLLVEEKPIPVIKTVLRIVSPVFNAMFKDDFKEKDQARIPLPGKKLDDVLILLKCIYPNIAHKLSDGEAFTVLPLAHEYQITSLVSTCENILLETLQQKFEVFYQKDCNFLYKFLSASVTYGLSDLNRYSVSLAADFKQEEREAAMKMFVVPIQTTRAVDRIALARHEIYRKDVEELFQNIEDGKLLKSIEAFCNKTIRGKGMLFFGMNPPSNPEFQEDNIEVIRIHMRGLRLAYAFASQHVATLKKAVMAVRKDTKCFYWCCNDEFDLLPENIKRDFNGVMVPKF